VTGVQTCALPICRIGLTPVSFFLVLLIAYITYKIQIVVILTLLALVFATVIEGPLRRLEARRIPRGVGILIIYATILGAVALLVIGLVPAVSDQADNFRTDVPTQLRTIPLGGCPTDALVVRIPPEGVPEDAPEDTPEGEPE
jgi:predicted PurR-regulated permease PerM